MPIERYFSLALGMALGFGAIHAGAALGGPWAHFALYSAITALLVAGAGMPLLVVGALIAVCGFAESVPQADALDLAADLSGIIVTAGLALKKDTPCAESSAP